MEKKSISRAALLSLAFVTLAALPAAAKTITRCGASEGYRYDVPGPLTKEPELGWKKDKISGGEFQLILDGAEADIITADAVGTRSSKADGATMVVLTGDMPGTFIVLAAYTTGTLEHFLFQLGPSGDGEVVWGTSRAQGMFPKSSLMRAKCRRP